MKSFLTIHIKAVCGVCISASVALFAYVGMSGNISSHFNFFNASSQIEDHSSNSGETYSNNDSDHCQSHNSNDITTEIVDNNEELSTENVDDQNLDSETNRAEENNNNQRADESRTNSHNKNNTSHNNNESPSTDHNDNNGSSQSHQKIWIPDEYKEIYHPAEVKKKKTPTFICTGIGESGNGCNQKFASIGDWQAHRPNP